MENHDNEAGKPKLTPPPLPERLPDVPGERKIPYSQLARAPFHQLYNASEEFRRLLAGINNETSAEGSLTDDDVSATIMFREFLDESSPLKLLNLRDLRHAMGHAARYHNVGRTQRYRLALESASGAEVDDNDDNDDHDDNGGLAAVAV